MSQSEPAARRPGRLVVDAPLGVGISVANGAFVEVAGGVTSLDVELDEGVYVVRLSAAGRARQVIVRVRPDETARVDETPVPDIVSETDPAASWRAAVAATAVEVPMPMDTTRIVVVVLAQEANVRADLSRGVVLRDGEGLVVDRDPACASEGGNGCLRLEFEVDGGCYELAYHSFERLAMAQTVYAPRGRRTVVLLRYARTALVTRAKQEPSVRKRRGIDPAGTLVVSTGPDASRDELARALETAEILLHHLKVRPTSLNVEVPRALDRKNRDPHLQLYAAAAALARPGVPLDRLTAVIGGLEDQPDLLAVARSLQRRLSRHADWPDVRCLGWRLQDETAVSDGGGLRRPPMLEIAWRWAASATAGFGPARRIEPRAATAAHGADPAASPWLAVRRSASSTDAHSSDPASAAVESGEALGALSATLQRAETRMAESLRLDASSTSLVPFLDFAALSPSTERVVRTVVSSGGPQAWVGGGRDFLKHMAGSLAAPVAELGPVLRLAEEEVSGAIGRYEAEGVHLLSSDPNKGAFGGSSADAGATLELASFHVQDGLGFVALELLVTSERSRPIDGAVTFHLHPTFSPHVQEVRVTERRAAFTCYAWGAFTVGVETADGRRLELDLALEMRLPAWFRGR